MSDQERQQGFINGLAALEQQFGCQLQSSIQSEVLNSSVVQLRIVTQIIPIPGWIPPKPIEEKKDE